MCTHPTFITSHPNYTGFVEPSHERCPDSSFCRQRLAPLSSPSQAVHIHVLFVQMVNLQYTVYLHPVVEM